MTLQIRTGGVSKAVQSAYVMSGGTLKRVVEIKAMVGGALKSLAIFAGPLSVVSTNVNNGGAAAFGSTTNLSQATVTGGVAPYTYARVLLSDPSGVDPDIDTPLAAGTTFTRDTLNEGACTFRVTVTDALGTVATDDFTATWINLS